MLQNIARFSALRLFPAKCSPLYFAHDLHSKTHAIDPEKEVRITLIKLNEDVEITYLQEAKKFSEENKLKLVKITDLDVKTRRPLYRLMETDHLHKERLKIRELKKQAKEEFTIKGQKTIIFSTKTGQHDMDTKCKKIIKWLEKHFEVKITISSPDANISGSEKVYAKLLKDTQGIAKSVQKVTKQGEIKFYLRPIPPSEREIPTAKDTKEEETVKNPQLNPEENEKDNL